MRQAKAVRKGATSESEYGGRGTGESVTKKCALGWYGVCAEYAQCQIKLPRWLAGGGGGGENVDDVVGWLRGERDGGGGGGGLWTSTPSRHDRQWGTWQLVKAPAGATRELYLVPHY